MSGSLRAAVTKGVALGASLEEKVEWVLRRDQEAQQEVNALTGRLADFEQASAKRLDELRAELRQDFDKRLVEEVEKYRPLRALGAVALAIGLACTIVVNFI